MDRLEKIKSKFPDPAQGIELDDLKILDSLTAQKLISDEEREAYLKDSSFGLMPKSREDKQLSKVKLAIAYTQLYAANRAGIAEYLEGDRQEWEIYRGSRLFLSAGFDLTEILYRDLDKQRSPEETEAKAIDTYVAKLFNLAQTFVRAKRERLRMAIFPFLRVQIAGQLLEPEEMDGFLTAPHLRDAAKSNGFRLKAKTINESDKKALDALTNSILLFMETEYLHRTAGERNKKYTEWLDSDSEEPFLYNDILDEFIASFVLYDVMDIFFRESFFGVEVDFFIDRLNGFSDFGASGSEDMTEKRKNLFSSFKQLFDKVAASKFSYLVVPRK